MAERQAHGGSEHAPASGDGPAWSADQVWRLLAPWLGHVLLVGAGVLGLFTASGASDDATYDAGLATFVLAVVIIVMRMRRQLDGREVGLLLPMLVTGADSLLIAIAVLTVLGLAGVVLAATVGGTLYGIGLALFAISATLIFTNLKRYFDRADGG